MLRLGFKSRALRSASARGFTRTFRRYSHSQDRSALFISPVWPEPSSSAAGVRTEALISLLLSQNWKISYLRFLGEEAFSFRLRELSPSTLRVLDLQDLHFIRRGREQVLKQGGSINEVLQHAAGPTDDCLRELASIHRSDLVLVCSPEELRQLRTRYQVPGSKLQLAPFFVKPGEIERGRQFSERCHFMTIGNFRHAPNLDAVKWMAHEIWPRIRSMMPEGVELHVYGAYGESREVMSLHDPAEGFHIKGHAPDLSCMEQYRVCLAPLRFGAGLKGKIVDAWRHGLPVVTTPIGAEGMHAGNKWGGLWQADSAGNFAKDAVTLYNNEQMWEPSRSAGIDLLRRLYDAGQNLKAVMDTIEGALQNLEEQRASDFVGNMLWMQQSRATEYFSRWIELKESIQSK